MIVIGIANTLDLPDKLTSRISSRLGSKRVIFIPYNSEQIKTIIQQRLKKSQIFDHKAIEFVAKKVSTVSSDIRITLDFCRNVVKDHLKKGVRKLISIDDVRSTFKKRHKNPFVDFIKSCPLVTKICILSFYNEIVHRNKRIVSSVGVYKRFCSILKLEDLPQYSLKEFRLVIDQLYSVGFLVLKGKALVAKKDIRAEKNKDSVLAQDYVRTLKSCNNGDLVVNVRFEIDDIEFALKNNKIWLDYGYLGEEEKE